MPRRIVSSRLTTGIYGVVGQNIEYSLSPYIFQNVFESLGWPAVFALFDMNRHGIGPLLSAMHKVMIHGLSVTTPHKEAVIPLLDRLDPSAEAVGAVNAIVPVRGRLVGYNTDVAGASFALRPHRGRLRGRDALIFGAGGGARSVAYALLAVLQMKSVTIASRTPSRARKLIHHLQDRIPHSHLGSTAFRPSSDLSDALADAALIVNATFIGSGHVTTDKILPVGTRLRHSTIAFDLAYRPRPTQFSREARHAGCRTVIDGWPMLVAQANAAFALWTGRGFPNVALHELLNLKSLP